MSDTPETEVSSTANSQSASALSVALGVLYVVIGVAALVAAALIGRRMRDQRRARQESDRINEYFDGNGLTPPAQMSLARRDSFARNMSANSRTLGSQTRQLPRLSSQSPRGFLRPLLRVLSGVRHEPDLLTKPSAAHDGSTKKALEIGSRVIVPLEKSRVADESVKLGELVFKGAYLHLFLATVEDPEHGDRKALASRLASDAASRDPQQIQVFMDEVARSISLSYPKIVPFLGFCQIDSSPCSLMEQLPNGDLESFLAVRPHVRQEFQWLERGKWPKSKAEIALDIVDALVHLHSLTPKIYMRDLRARQVWLAEDFSAKLLCFGNDHRLEDLASVARGRIESFGGAASSPTASASLSSAAFGGRCCPRENSIAWMAPELLRGQQEPDEQTVVYALGVLLTELDTCELPYTLGMDDMDREQVATLVSSGCIRPSLAMDCPVPIQELILKCLSFAPKDRPSTAEIQSSLKKIATRSRLTHAASVVDITSRSECTAEQAGGSARRASIV